MFSGKTNMLLTHEQISYRSKHTVSIIFVKYIHDQRYSTSNQVISHSGQQNLEQTKVVMTDSLLSMFEQLTQYNIIYIDEGQFYKDIHDFLKRVSREFPDIEIYISGLSGDYKQEPFSTISSIIPLCEKIVHLQSLCHKCGKNASFTERLTQDTQQEVIGGNDMYLPICYKCLNKKTT